MYNHIQENLIEAVKYHSLKRLELYPSKKEDALYHARIADSLQTLVNNIAFILTPLEYENYLMDNIKESLNVQD